MPVDNGFGQRGNDVVAHGLGHYKAWTKHIFGFGPAIVFELLEGVAGHLGFQARSGNTEETAQVDGDVIYKEARGAAVALDPLA